MEDLKIINFDCDHKIFDEILSIEGTTPNYFAYLKYPSNKSISDIQVREYCTEHLTNYIYKRDGITSW